MVIDDDIYNRIIEFNPTRPGGGPSRPAVNFRCLDPKNEKC